MSVLKSTRREMIGSGIVYAVLGILLCAWPVGTAGVMCVIAGMALLAGGVWRAVGYFRKKECGLNDRMDFTASAMLTILGAVLVSKPELFIALVPFILGVLILTGCIFKAQMAAELKKIGYSRWFLYLAGALVCGITALVMMFDPFGSYRMMAAVMGAAFIANGAAELWTALYLKGKLKKMGLME